MLHSLDVFERTETGATTRTRLILGVVVLVLCITTLYVPSYSGEFIFDDVDHVVNDTSVRALMPPRETWLNTRRPVVKLTIALQYQLHGLDVRGFHIFNVAAHCATALLLLFLIFHTLRLTPLREHFDERRAAWLSLTTVLLWSIHPLQTQAVSYIIQRAEVLVSFFILGTLYCLLRGSTARRCAWLWYIGCVGCCLLSMGTKEVGAITPVVALLFDRAFLAQSLPRTLRRRWWLYGLLILPYAGIVWLGVGDIFSPQAAAGFGMDHMTWWSYLKTQPLVIAKYICLIFWPAVLSIDHMHPTVDMSTIVTAAGLSWWPVAAVGALLALGTGLSFTFRRPRVGFLILAFFFVLAPSSSFIPVADVMVEHRIYLVSSIVIFSAALTANRLLDHLRRSRSQSKVHVVAMICVCMIASGLGWRTWIRNKDYQSNLSLWIATTQTNPTNARAWNNLGGVLLQMSNPAHAVAPLQRAVQIAPGYSGAWTNLATALAELQQFDDAYRVTVLAEQRLGRTPTALLVTRGWALVELGQLAEARGVLLEAVRDDPDNAYAWTNLANVECGLGHIEAGIQAYDRALVILPSHVNALIGRGATYMEQGNEARARADLKKASTIDPQNPLPYYNRGNLEASRGDWQLAIREYSFAIERAPRHIPSRFNRAAILLQLGQAEAARPDIFVLRDAGATLPADMARVIQSQSH